MGPRNRYQVGSARPFELVVGPLCRDARPPPAGQRHNEGGAGGAAAADALDGPLAQRHEPPFRRRGLAWLEIVGQRPQGEAVLPIEGGRCRGRPGEREMAAEPLAAENRLLQASEAHLHRASLHRRRRRSAVTVTALRRVPQKLHFAGNRLPVQPIRRPMHLHRPRTAQHQPQTGTHQRPGPHSAELRGENRSANGQRRARRKGRGKRRRGFLPRREGCRGSGP